ncbi:MAG: AfsR/SARP family transcriptional regulator [Streptosporangiaceae bacterium]
MDFGLLGPLVVRDGTRQVPVSAPQQRVLLAALLLSAGRVVSLDDLAEMLWEGQPPSGARGALHSGVQRLRSTLGPRGADLIETRPPGYLIRLDDSELDVHQFSVLAARGHAAADADTWALAADLLREALGWWRGEPLADVPSRLLHDREVRPIEDQRLQALVARIDCDLHLGRHGEVVAELRQLVRAHPLQEQFHAQLMLGLYRNGRQAEALAAYQDVRRILADELGLDPGPELRLMHQRILAADGELLIAAGGASSAAPATLSLDGPERAAPVQDAPDGGVSDGGVSDRAAPDLRAPATTREDVIPRLLPMATRHFAGRAVALGELAALADEASRATVIAVIAGTAGVGKTSLALHFAHRVAARFPDGQLYVNLRGFDPAGAPMAPAEAVRLFLDALAVPAARIPVGLDAQSGLYRSLLAGRRVLVLLDNARDVDQVRPLLPAGSGSLVIVTSRKQLTSLVAGEGALPLTLDVLGDTEAQELLTRRLGPLRVADDPGAADDLIKLCAQLPLALSIAAARTASQPGLSLAALTADLRDARGRLDALDAGHSAANVRAVMSWSYQQLDAEAARLFRLLGLHAGLDISAAAAASLAGLPPDQARRSLGELTRAHLLAEPTPGRFTCHDLLRAYAAELTQSADSEAERHAATSRVLDHYLYTANSAALALHPTRRPVTLPPLRPGAEPEHIDDAGEALAWLEAEYWVLVAAAGQALEEGFDTHVWQIAWALSRFLDMRSRWHDWVIIEQLALDATQRLGDQAAQASVHERYGFASARLGGFEDAYAHLERALSIHTERGDHAGQGYARNAMANMLNWQGRYAEALDQAEQALTSYTAIGDRSGRALALNSVGWFHAVLGDHQEALSYCSQALDLYQDLGNQEATASTLDSLGYAHQQADHHADAMACYQQAIEIHREIGSRLGLAETLGHLGDNGLAAGNPAQARAAWEEALAILDDVGHPDADRVRGQLRELDTAVLNADRS